MAQLPIYNSYHPVLNKKTEEIEDVDDELRKLAEDMFETMYKANGIGLSANQVGVSKSLVVIDTSMYRENGKNYTPLLLINPEIILSSDSEVEYQEGCLSVPKYYDYVMRPADTQVRYYDLDMKEHIIEADDILARVIQHEIDHLNGILFYERLTSIRRTLAKSKLKKIQRGKVIPDYPMIMADGKRV
jgi:peptide deformylase